MIHKCKCIKFLSYDKFLIIRDRIEEMR